MLWEGWRGSDSTITEIVRDHFKQDMALRLTPELHIRICQESWFGKMEDSPLKNNSNSMRKPLTME